jgi:UDPglucose 6-dehydrogenase
MTVINFAYDDEVLGSNQDRYFKNVYDNKFYPVNGLYDDCYYDYHAPLQSTFDYNNIPTKSITLKTALSNNERFVYVLTFRNLPGTLNNSSNHNIFEHISVGLIKAINSGRCLLIINDAHECCYYTSDFYSVLKNCLDQACIKFNNVLVLTGNTRNEKESDSDIKVLVWQYYETAMRMTASKNPIDTITEYAETNSLKKFLCLNRISRETRYWFMYHMYKNKLLGDFNASLDQVDDLNDIVSHHHGVFLNEIKDDPDFSNMLATLPWIVDTDKFKINHWDSQNHSFATNNIIFIITETLFFNGNTELFLTEKTFKPMALKMPFIIVGTCGILRKLREMGYITFNELWDESYDDEPDPKIRMEKIVSLVKDIATKYSTKELLDLIIANNDILEHNYNLLMRRRPEAEIIKYIREYTMQVAMIGCGKLGLPCAEVMSQHYDVVGYDIVKDPGAQIELLDTIKDAVTGRDLIFVAVPTPHDPEYSGSKPIADLPSKDFDYSIVQQVLTEINQYVNKNQLVVLISTVLPGTVRAHLEPCITNARFIYNPYLIAMGSVKWDMVNPECLIIGTEDGSRTGDAQALVDFYQPIMQNNPQINVGTWDEAECIKVFYNTFISAKIGLVNMIQDVAEKNGNINVDIVTDALKAATQRITGPRYLTAGMGDAGACHPRDNIALRYLAERLDLGYDLFQTIMYSRDQQAKNMALKLVALSREHNLPVVIHGRAYKPYVEYTIGSYSELVGHFVEAEGVSLAYADPLTGDEWSGRAVILMAHNPTITYAGTGVEVLPDQFYFNIEPGSIVLDPWRTIPKIKGSKVIHYGNTRKTHTINYDLIQAIPEIDSLEKIVKLLPENPTIVEIGTYLGGTTRRLAKVRPDSNITTVDRCNLGPDSNWNEPYNDYVRTYIVEKVLQDDVSKQHLLNNIGRFNNINFIEGFSPECLINWDKPIDLYFEDGDHFNPALSKNLNFWSRFVKPGGYMAVDDYCDECPDIIVELDKFIKLTDEWELVLQDRRLRILRKKIT